MRKLKSEVLNFSLARNRRVKYFQRERQEGMWFWNIVNEKGWE